MRAASEQPGVPDLRVETGARRVLVAQALWDGHRLLYVRRLADLLLQRGDVPLVLLAPQAEGSAEFSRHLGGRETDIRVLFGDPASGAAVAAAAREHGATHVVMPDGDAYLRELATAGWRGPSTISLLVMRPSGQSRLRWAQRAESLAKTLLRAAARRRGIRVFTLVSALRRSIQPFEIRDPAEIGADPVRREGALRSDLTPDRYWFGVVGAITLRKNLQLIAESLGELEPSRFGLLVAGVCDEDALRSADEPLTRFVHGGGEVIVDDRLLEDEEFAAAVRSVDCLLVVHSNEGASGVLAKAAAAGTRVVAGGAQSLRRDVADCPGLAVWTTAERSMLTAAMSAAAAMSRPEPILPLAGGSLEKLL